jgi:phospholipase/lecithinase/hemolysin
MALYIITNKTIKMANNGKGIGPRGLGAPKSMAKYGSMAKQAEEPKTGTKKEKKENSAKKAVEKVAKAVSNDLVKGGAESKRQTRLARGAQRGTFFGLEKLFD